MDSFSKGIALVAVFALMALFSQAYFWRRKIHRIADAEVKQLDLLEWKRHMNFTRYMKLVSRFFWGTFFIFWAANYAFHWSAQSYMGFMAITAFIGLFFIGWAILGFRGDSKIVNRLD
jgi:hypothetical protein